VFPIWNTSGTTVDVGCGTGFQSFLYAATGARVVGFDIADQLVKVARLKALNGINTAPSSLFPSHFKFVDRYNQMIGRLFEKTFANAKPRSPVFAVGSALALPLPDGSASHVNCCGSVLSLLEDSDAALDEIARVLCPRGTFVIEVEAKLNPDLIWPLIDATVLRGRLGYETSFREAADTFFGGPNVKTQFPFGEIDDPIYMDITLFSKGSLVRSLRERGLKVHGTRAIHSVTNLIPSTVLDTPSPQRRLRVPFATLSRLEELGGEQLPGCSLVLFGIRS
jgi:SAM-dependent methyltransferase